SYLVGWLSRNDLQVAANQELTRRWWLTRRQDFQLFASSVVIDEVSDGDTALATERLKFLADTTLLAVTPAVHALKQDLVRLSHIPAKADTDALHIAVAAVHGIDYVLTWNCRHIANAVILPSVYEVCRDAGYEPPFVCTPQELMGE
ncbi:MAG TPA: type II toxin-antitoxin system VapC family toxin, partial [Thermoanaerobaculia bacterium]